MCIRDRLQKYSDADHRLSQKDIGDILEKEYNMKADRKAIRRNIMDLMDYGFDIEYDEIIRMIPVKDKTNGKEKISLHTCLLYTSMAFIMNVPMSFFERQIDRLQRRSYSKIIAKARTPLCMIVTLAVFVLAIFFIGRVIFPNLAQAVRGIAAVSYTHLDVYKRQAYHLAVADLGFDILNVKIKIVKVDLDPGRS